MGTTKKGISWLLFFSFFRVMKSHFEQCINFVRNCQIHRKPFEFSSFFMRGQTPNIGQLLNFINLINIGGLPSQRKKAGKYIWFSDEFDNSKQN